MVTPIFDLAAALLRRLQPLATPAELVAAYDEARDQLAGVVGRDELDWSQGARLTFALSRAYRNRLDSLQPAGMAVADWHAHLAGIKSGQLDVGSDEQWGAPSPARPGPAATPVAAGRRYRSGASVRGAMAACCTPKVCRCYQVISTTPIGPSTPRPTPRFSISRCPTRAKWSPTCSRTPGAGMRKFGTGSNGKAPWVMRRMFPWQHDA